MNYTGSTLKESVQRFKKPIKLETGSLYQARTVEKIPNAQDGGVVTGLLGYALDNGIIKGAVVVGKDVHWNTFPVLATDSQDLKNYAGSAYFPINNKDYRAMVRKAADTFRDIGIVVTPCELEVLDSGSNMVKLDEVYLKVGLFCLGSFNPVKFWNYVDEGIKEKTLRDLKLIRNSDS